MGFTNSEGGGGSSGAAGGGSTMTGLPTPSATSASSSSSPISSISSSSTSGPSSTRRPIKESSGISTMGNSLGDVRSRSAVQSAEGATGRVSVRISGSVSEGSRASEALVPQSSAATGRGSSLM